jgi:hypothetical protein
MRNSQQPISTQSIVSKIDNNIIIVVIIKYKKMILNRIAKRSNNDWTSIATTLTATNDSI